MIIEIGLAFETLKIKKMKAKIDDYHMTTPYL